MSVALKVLGVAWQVVVSPDPLVDGELRFMAEPDEEQHVIWLDPPSARTTGRRSWPTSFPTSWPGGLHWFRFSTG
jgi:hypothetical protein